VSAHRIHGIYFSSGNKKVRFPILNLGPGLTCPSRQWCPFDGENNKAAGRKRCYAQKTEILRPNVYHARYRNQAIVENLCQMEDRSTLVDTANDVADGLFALVKNKRKVNRIVRLNESGDLSKANIEFACALIRALLDRGVKTYLYSKAPPIMQRLAREAGATVLHSEHDFIAVPNETVGDATGLNKCPGVCGPCKACPSGVKSWIVEH
jgi:hypothetical protein